MKNVEVYAPEFLGKCDVLVLGERVAAVERDLSVVLPELLVLDAEGAVAFPGFIDPHVHLLGGGGEAGFSSRIAEVTLDACLRAGVTTVVGCLGTDGVTRSLEGLYAKAKALEETGLTTYIYTGSYRVPPVTLTGSVQRDLVLIDKVIGVGEIAISDHRSSQPTFEEVARLVADARVGGLLSGKAGVVNFHVGAGPRGIEYLFRIVELTEIPVSHLYPTHMNRSERLFEEGLKFIGIGGIIDLTAIQPFERAGVGEFTAADALEAAYAEGFIDNVTLSSDAGGSLPVFDESGDVVEYKVGTSEALLHTVNLVVERGLPLQEVLKVCTVNPAKILKLRRKGRIGVGFDADIVLLDNFRVLAVISRGKLLLKDGEVLYDARVPGVL